MFPFHIQEWFLDHRETTGSFSLLYTEPSPQLNPDTPVEGTVDEDFLTLVLRSYFTGYRSHRIHEWQLGFNGLVRDVQIELHYGSHGDRALDALYNDLAALNHDLYGTAYGTKIFEVANLGDVIPFPQIAPSDVVVGSQKVVEFIQGPTGWYDPETLSTRSFSTTASRKAFRARGAATAQRLISDDERLVLLTLPNEVVRESDHAAAAAVTSALRKFTLDSDSVLGGVVDEALGRVFVLGRARNLSRLAYPALRVEDLLVALNAQEDEWAQSFDRSSFGAGRVLIEPGSFADVSIEGPYDWGPAYLSAGLIGTEIGSLLNITDSYLKSWSQSKITQYVGTPIEPPRLGKFPGGAEGLYTKLVNEFPGEHVTQLVFNFNSVGMGQWSPIASVEKRASLGVYSTASLFPSYSIDETGQDEGEVASRLRNYEELFHGFFAAARNPHFGRSVGYYIFYNLAQRSAFSLPGHYPNLTERRDDFEVLGKTLANATRMAWEVCLEGLELGDAPWQVVREQIALSAGEQIAAGPSGPLPLAKALREIDSPEEFVNGILDTVLTHRYPSLSKNDLNDEIDSYNRLVSETTNRIDDFNDSVDRINKRIDKFNRSSIQTASEERAIVREQERIQQEHQSLDRVQADLAARAQWIDELRAAGRLTAAYASAADRFCSQDFMSIFGSSFASTGFRLLADRAESLHQSPFIRTPTTVLSRNFVENDRVAGLGLVGGHNLPRRTVEVVIDPRVPAGTPKFDKDAYELRLNPNDRERSASVARAFGRFENASEARLQSILNLAALNGKPSVASADLLMPANELTVGGVRIAGTTFDAAPLRLHKAVLAANDNVAADVTLSKDPVGVTITRFKNGTAKSTIYPQREELRIAFEEALAQKSDSGDAIRFKLADNLSAKEANNIINSLTADVTAMSGPDGLALASAGGAGGGQKPPFIFRLAGSQGGGHGFGNFGRGGGSGGHWQPGGGGRPFPIVFRLPKDQGKRVFLRTKYGTMEIRPAGKLSEAEMVEILSSNLSGQTQVVVHPIKQAPFSRRFVLDLAADGTVSTRTDVRGTRTVPFEVALKDYIGWEQQAADSVWSRLGRAWRRAFDSASTDTLGERLAWFRAEFRIIVNRNSAKYRLIELIDQNEMIITEREGQMNEYLSRL